MKQHDFEAPVLSPYGHVFEKDTPGPLFLSAESCEVAAVKGV